MKKKLSSYQIWIIDLYKKGYKMQREPMTGSSFFYKNGKTIIVRNNSVDALIKINILSDETHPKLKNDPYATRI